jgi:hypothetical protein
MWNNFVTALGGLGYVLDLDGGFVEELSSEDFGRLEFRMDGPKTRQLRSDRFVLDRIVINIHGQVMDGQGDLAAVRRIMGLVESWLGQDHCINRLGPDTGGIDDGSLVGTLVLQTEGRLDGVESNSLGHEEHDSFSQFSVSAPFRMYLTSGD